MQKKIKRGELSETFTVKVLPVLANGLPMLINRRSKSLYISLFLLFLLNNCVKEAEFHEKAYPYLITNEVSDITGTSIVFNAEIISTGNEPVLEYGFLWGSTSTPNLETAYRITLDDPATVGKFSAKIDFNLHNDRDQFVRSYMKTSRFTVFGNTISFVCNGGVPHEINEITPEKGYTNTPVVITGNNFGTSKEKISIYFGEIAAHIDSCTNNTIYLRVPQIELDQEEKIRVSIYGKEVESDIDFRAFSYWKRIADFPGNPRSSAVAFTINNIGYVGLGRNAVGNNFFKDFYAFDPQTNTWSKIADFPGQPRGFAAAGVIDGKAYVGFGMANHLYYHDLWQYDPETDTWTKMLEDNRVRTYSDAHFVVNDEFYILRLHSTYKYLPTSNQFVAEESFPGDYRFFSSGLTFDGKGYVIAGQRPGNQVLKDFWSFDPVSDTWTRKADLPAGPRDGLAAFAVNDRIYAGLGRVLQTDPLEFFEYNPSTDIWTSIGLLMSDQRRMPACFTIEDKAYVGLGVHSGNNASHFWKFDSTKE